MLGLSWEEDAARIPSHVYTSSTLARVSEDCSVDSCVDKMKMVFEGCQGSYMPGFVSPGEETAMSSSVAADAGALASC